MLNRKKRKALLIVLATLSVVPASAQAASASKQNSFLVRRYREGEKIAYHMKASNRGHLATSKYEIQANGVVKKDSAGRFIEEFTWSNMVSNGKPVTSSKAATDFRQVLSLDPGYPLTVPNLINVLNMVGPITDLLTLYADMSVKNQGRLKKAGDHFYFPHGTPASWADGNYVVLGEDSIDFDVSLTKIDKKDKKAQLTIRHVPPAEPKVKIPAEWMREKVADTPNNWVEVAKEAPDKFFAEVGRETFDVKITVNLKDGRILSATIDNPVEVKARECSDAALTKCGEPMRYQILRQIEVQAVP